jgi:hypothetical protein
MQVPIYTLAYEGFLVAFCTDSTCPDVPKAVEDEPRVIPFRTVRKPLILSLQLKYMQFDGDHKDFGA